MTLKDLISKVTNWSLANEAGDRISKEITAVRKEYIGKAAWETLPRGAVVACVILEIDWVQAYGTQGGWSVAVQYLEGDMKNYVSWTSDKVLQFSKGSK